MAGAATGGVPVNPMQQASGAQMGALAGTAAGMAYQPGQIGSLAQTDIGQYQNPYTQQVIDATQADVLRGAQQGINALDYQAGRAGAFGGSRHGVALGELGTGVAQQLAQTSAGLRQAGFQNAQQMAQQDIQNRLSQQNLNLAGAQQRLGAAQQLAGLGQQSFGYGTALQSQLAAQGQQQQAMEQALIDAAKAQYAGYTGAPAAGLGYVSQALGATTVPTSTTQTKQPGLFDYLTLAASAV